MEIPPVAGKESVTFPVEEDATIWFAVPVIEVTAIELKVPHEAGLLVVATRTCPVVPAANHEGTPPVPEMSTPLLAAVI